MNFLADRALRGQEKRAHTEALKKLAEGPNPVGDWLHSNVATPLGMQWSDQQKQLAGHLGSGLGLGLGAGALTGLYSAMQTPRKKRNIFSSILQGGLLGAAAGAGGGGLYHALTSGVGQPPAGKEPPKPTPSTDSKAVAGLKSTVDAAKHAPGAMLPESHSNIGNQGLIPNISRAAGTPASADEAAKKLDTPTHTILLDPASAAMVAQGGPAAIEKVKAQAREKSIAIDKQTGKAVSLIPDGQAGPGLPESVFDQAMQGLAPTPPAGLNNNFAQSLTTGHTGLDVGLGVGAVDATGRALRGRNPGNSAITAGIGSLSPIGTVPPEMATAVNATPAHVRQPLLDAVAERGMHGTLLHPTGDIHKAVQGPLTAQLAENASKIKGVSPRLGGADIHSTNILRTQTNEAMEAARGLGRAHINATGGKGFAGTRMLTGWKGILPYVVGMGGAHAAFDQPVGGLDLRLKNLYHPEVAKDFAERGLVPPQD